MAETENVQAQAAVAVADEKMQAQTAEFGEAVDSAQPAGENLNVLLDIQMPVTVVLGNTQVPFKRLLQVGPGSVLELDKSVGQPADIYVQDIHLATGDVVVVGENYGIRIREVLGGGSVQKLHAAAEVDPIPQTKKSE
jgi:flagellar motor switch protein FliN/FliY